MKWKEMLKPNKISIPLSIILFIIFSYIFLLLPAATCESLFLGDKFKLRFPWSDVNTSMRMVNLEYEKCISKIAPLLFFGSNLIIAYILTSFIVYQYKKRGYK